MSADKSPRPVCPRCGCKHYSAGLAEDGRPQFKCLNGSCEHTWTSGHDGGRWVQFAREVDLT